MARRELALVSSGLAGSWAIGLLILVGQASEQVTGPSTILALLMAAISSLLSAVCRGQLEALPVRRRRRSHMTEDFPGFLTMWLSLLANLMALAAISRALSATMDYIAGWRHQLWIQNKMGPLPSILGGRLPDMMALVVAVVISLLFIMGLEHSTVLRLILNASLMVTVMFFIVMGFMQVETSNWMNQSVLPAGWSGFLTAAALYSFGFLGFMSLMSQSYVQTQTRKMRLAAAMSTLLVMLFSYCAFAVILSMMYHFQALVGSPVPLLRAFEIRDVDWARLVMAIFSIVGLALALLEVCTPLYAVIVCLGGEEWKVLPPVVTREYSGTGTPVLAILAAGVPACLLACVCPLGMLVQIMCAGPLLDHAFNAATLIHRSYQPTSDKRGKCTVVRNCHRNGDDDDDNDDTEAVGLKQHKLTVRCLKSGLGFLPAAIRGPEQQFYTSLSSPVPHTQSNGTLSNVTYIDPDNISLVRDNMKHSLSNGTIVTSLSYDSMTQGQMDTRIVTNGSVTSLKSIDSMIMDQSENKQPIHNGEAVTPTNEDDDLLIVGSDCETLSARHYSNDETALCRGQHNLLDKEDPTLSSASSSSSDESDSNNTDIDAIVEEYKERIKVATTLTGVQPHVLEPTLATGRRVTLCLAGILMCVCVVAIATVLDYPVNIWCGCLGLVGATFLLTVVLRQPQNQRKPLVPWLPSAVVLINAVLSMHLLATFWPVVVLWLTAGFVMYWRKRGLWRCRYRPGFSSSRREQIRLHAPPRHPTVSTLIPSHRCLPDDRVRRLTQVDTILISR